MFKNINWDFIWWLITNPSYWFMCYPFNKEIDLLIDYLIKNEDKLISIGKNDCYLYLKFPFGKYAFWLSSYSSMKLNHCYFSENKDKEYITLFGKKLYDGERPSKLKIYQFYKTFYNPYKKELENDFKYFFKEPK